MSRPKLPRAPLVLVVAQVRFSPIEDIDKYIPAIKAKLRTSYPYFDTCHLQQITMIDNGVQLSGIEQWFFTDRLKQTNLVLSKHSFAVNTVNYNTFDEYLPKVYSAMEEISTILNWADCATLEQVSLRYVDWIYPLDGVSSERMIKDEYLGGYLDDDGVQLRQVILERKTSLGGVVRTIIYRPNNPQVVLGEFQSIRLNQPKFTEGTSFIILDMVHSKPTQGEDFTRDHILSVLESLHDEVDRLFKQIPSQEAHRIWEKEAE